MLINYLDWHFCIAWIIILQSGDLKLASFLIKKRNFELSEVMYVKNEIHQRRFGNVAGLCQQKVIQNKS